MTRAIIKNARLKFLVSSAALFLIFIVLMGVEGFTPTEAVRIVLGGSVLGRPILVTSFMAYIAMLQFINIDAIDYLLNENTYLLVRYQDKKILYKKLMTVVTVLNIIFILIIVIVAEISIFCIEPSKILTPLEIIEFFARGLLSGIFCSFVQLLLVITFDGVKTFMFMTAFAVLCAFLSISEVDVFSIFPYALTGTALFINVIICIALDIILIAVCNLAYKRKRSV